MKHDVEFLKLQAPAEPGDGSFIPKSVLFSKRLFDILISGVACALLIPPFPLVALAIKLTSPGPVFYRQLRVGRASPRCTQLFYVIKLRTMYVDAEARSGAVWASKNDPRITPVGRFLRKTRIDELPQIINVLLGEMSFIGPRPERPQFFVKLNEVVPYYSERVYGLKPGITGLAQVSQGYDESIDDVKRKVMFDHAYAARLTSFRQWVQADAEILFRTVGVVLMRKGQ
jgi:lipopolysaccharide/colanic/teichoic acid biosynthesis glycosyltransferase